MPTNKGGKRVAAADQGKPTEEDPPALLAKQHVKKGKHVIDIEPRSDACRVAFHQGRPRPHRTKVECKHVEEGKYQHTTPEHRPNDVTGTCRPPLLPEALRGTHEPQQA